VVEAVEWEEVELVVVEWVEAWEWAEAVVVEEVWEWVEAVVVEEVWDNNKLNNI
jgi:hypothetical protein